MKPRKEPFPQDRKGCYLCLSMVCKAPANKALQTNLGPSQPRTRLYRKQERLIRRTHGRTQLQNDCKHEAETRAPLQTILAQQFPRSMLSRNLQSLLHPAQLPQRVVCDGDLMRCHAGALAHVRSQDGAPLRLARPQAQARGAVEHLHHFLGH